MKLNEKNEINIRKNNSIQIILFNTFILLYMIQYIKIIHIKYVPNFIKDS